MQKHGNATRAKSQAKNRKRPFPLHQRRKDLARLVVFRHDRLPHDGWTFIKVAAEHCPRGPNRRDAMMHWLGLVCAPASIRRRRQVDDILHRVPPRCWSADALGRHLRMTDIERATLHIGTFGSYETPKAERERCRKEKHRLAEQARRRANGSKPREQSLSRTKPWEAEGISRRTWYRRHPVAQIRAQDSFCNTGHESVPRDERAAAKRTTDQIAPPMTIREVMPFVTRGKRQRCEPWVQCGTSSGAVVSVSFGSNGGGSQ